MQQTTFRIRNFFLMVASLLLTFCIVGGAAYLYLDSQLPDVAALKDVQLPIPLRVYTSDGQLMAEFGELRRDPVTLNQVPPMLVKAILATEDQRFYEHPGVDFWGLSRASVQLMLTGTKSQGGSTITMQVARNFYLSRKKTFLRKITEILLALKIERELSKDQILELYLNKVYFGNRAYGIGAAAQVYFGKTLDQLTLPEMALIAGLPKAPSTMNPIANPLVAKDRRNHVLTRMYDLGDIDKQTYINAVNTPLTASYHGTTVAVRAPYVAEMVRDMMVTSFGTDAYTKGYNVYTTINAAQQIAANSALRDAILAYDHRHGYRGPEANFGTITPEQTESYLIKLYKIPSINGLKPAIVTSIASDRITALLSTNEAITIPWSSMTWARPVLPSGGLGAIPSSPAKVVKLGDIIRAQKEPDGTWSFEQNPKIEGALVALNPTNGAITALVGGFDFDRSKFNRVTQAYRQPGSSFKPFLYAAALAKGYTLSSVFSDSPISFNIPGHGVWSPANDKHEFYGSCTLRFAITKSINIISVKLLMAVGLDYAIRYIERFGFERDQLPRNLSMALGSASFTPLQMVRAFAVFANGGYLINPYFIDHITNTENNLVYQPTPKVACTACLTQTTMPPVTKDNPYAPEAIPPQIAFLMTSALKSVVTSGTGRGAMVLGRTDLGGKTGTTNEQVDTWFSGFNSDIVTTAWVGLDQPSSIHEYGAQAALPMWINFMKVALANAPMHTMPEPPGITSRAIDPRTGLQIPNGTSEFFTEDTVPPEETASTAASSTPFTTTTTTSDTDDDDLN